MDQNPKKNLEEKRTKYAKLAMELSKLRGWQKWKIVPIIAGATGIFGKRLEDELRIIIYSSVNIMRHIV